MRSFVATLLILLATLVVDAQGKNINTLKQDLQKATADSDRVLLNLNISVFYEELISDSSIFYATQALNLSRKNNQQIAEADALTAIAYQLMSSGNFGQSLKHLEQAFALASNTKSEKESWNLDEQSPRLKRLTTLSRVHNNLGILMSLTQNVEQEIFHFKQAGRIADHIGNKDWSQIADMNLGGTYLRLDQLDSAMYFAKKSESLFLKAGSGKNIYGFELVSLGDIYFKKNNLPLAKEYYYKSVKISKGIKNMASLTWGYFMLTRYFLLTKDQDSSLSYSYKTIESLKSLGFGYLAENINMGTAYENLYRSFQQAGKSDSAQKYLELALVTKDSLYKNRIKSLAEFQKLTFNEQLRLQSEKNEKIVYQGKVRTYGLLFGFIVCMIIASLFFVNSRNRRKANEVLLQQKEEIELQKYNVEKTLVELIATQSQLIQSEKMASLGELTAGIAHEIQNPLNFVNNFSELNKELLAEMKDEMGKENMADAEALANNVIENENKISHHGKRADAIVKGMLLHSQNAGGVKEATDINALADEYLRLAYHGFKAKDRFFNGTWRNDFDPNIGKVPVIPQDIGRVLLNLYNNAFYAVNEKIKSAPNGYEPQVTVSTRLVPATENSFLHQSLPAGRQGANLLIITVKDNGNGIPQKMLDKIFQPFFTTKPTGQGTGLGLSLSYDIVKAHGGEMKVESKEGEGTTFIIQLPIS